MDQRLATLAALSREAAMPALVFTWIATTGFGGIDNSRVARIAPSLAANASFSEAPAVKSADRVPAIALDVPKAVPASMPATETVTLASAADVAVEPIPAPPAAPASPEPIVTASLGDPAETLVPEITWPAPEQSVNPAAANLAPATGDQAIPAQPGADKAEVYDDECLVFEICVDRYLFALYQRAPKEDTIKTEHRRKVTIRRKGKRITVTRTFTKRTDENFSWKDPKAAEHAGMSMQNYVIGGMDPDFKLKLYYLLHAAEAAGLSPGITSAFRDDYRQSIASGLKAASNRSYHGGSLRGGYGHGLAADIVSVNGATRAQRTASSQVLWKWVDANGKEFGVGRPYLDRDPPHVGPIDGKEYADKHPQAARRADASAKRRSRIASARAR